MAEGDARPAMAQTDCIAELSAVVARLAAGPQRIFASGPGLYRSRGEQEGGRGANLSASRCEYAALCRRPLPAQPELRECDYRRQAAGPGVAQYGCGDPALHG